MRSSSFQSDPRDRAKSAAAAAAIHLALGAAFLTGLAISPERRTDDSLKTFDVAEPPPPPPPPVTEPSEPAKGAPAPAGKKADPSPIVAPPARLPTSQPVAAAPVAGTGPSPNAGAAASGSGTGAGGAGAGTGGGGSGAGRTGARLVSGGLGRGDYRQIAAMGSPRGDAELLLLINPAGRVERCRALRSSGNFAVDNALCQTLLNRARFAPAREADGSPLYQDVRYFPSWRR
ncbi:MAG TPA: energy transducer TonB [Sphingomicrobium sp.]|nr:energy transducer TonB [Sphingomicrobium sp.]